jgi:glycosyltransferase involved in cell wall biosynthesis
MSSTSAGSPRISVVVLTHNRAGDLVSTLSRLVALPEHAPVIVADNASDDETVALIDMLFPQVRIVQCGTDLGQAGRNRAVACVHTEYVAFCDDDGGWEPGSLDQAIRLLDRWPQIAVLNARVVAEGAQAAIDTHTEGISEIHPHLPPDSNALPGAQLADYSAAACVFRTEVFRAIGSYEPRLPAAAERLAALDVLAAGHAIVDCASLKVQRVRSDAHDDDETRRLRARDTAWVAWMRLPSHTACAATLHALREFLRQRRFWRDGAALLGGLGWALAHRRRVTRDVLRLRKQVLAAQRHAAAVGRSAATQGSEHAEPPDGGRHS